MLQGIELLIYDLDGTLIDSSDAICSTFNATLVDVGEPPIPTEHIKATIGEPLIEVYRRFLPPDKRRLADD